jgi:hypothetical protein
MLCLIVLTSSLLVLTDTFDATKTWDSTVEWKGWSWGDVERPFHHVPRFSTATSSSSSVAKRPRTNAAANSSSSSSSSVQPAKKRKSAAASSGGAGGGVLSGAGGAGVATKSHRAPPKPILNKPANPPAKLTDGTLTSEDESESEDDFDGAEELGANAEPDALDAAAPAVLKWELGKELPEVSGTFEGLGQPCVRIEPTTSAMFCFDLVFPPSLRNMMVLETHRYGRFLVELNNKRRPIPQTWVDLDDNEFLVYLGLVLVDIVITRLVFNVCILTARLRPP